MKIGLQLCYKEMFYQPGFYQKLFSENIKFTPGELTYGYKTMAWDNKKSMKIIENYDSDENLILDNGEGSLFSAVVSGSDHPHRSITIIQEKSIYIPTTQYIESIIDHTDFVSAWLYNEDYECIQSTRFTSDLKFREFSPEILASVKNTPITKGVRVDEFITKFNPGKSELLSYTMLMVAWKMWFGKPFFELVPKEKILSFPHATEIKELENGQVYVQLYDNVEEPYTPENVFRQWKWREWLDYDTLIEKYSGE